jgi:hypothetical protein
MAGILCNDPRFQKWAGLSGADAAAEMVRRVCGVTSRSEINANPLAAAEWDDLHSRYLTETGQLPEMRG